MSKIVLYYHIYLTDDNAAWSSIFLEQMKCAEDSGLLKHIDRMEITCISPNDVRREEFLNLCESYDASIVLDFVDKQNNDHHNMVNLNSSTTVSENYTYQKIYRDCRKEDMNVFYFHSKGITSFLRMLSGGNKLCAEEFKRYYYWRQFLNWGGIKNWRKHVVALDDHDVSGVNFQTYPSPHYSGAFWWSKSEWIRTLPDPTETDWWREIKRKSDDPWFKSAPDRYKDEHWLAFRENAKVFNIFDNKDNPFYTLLTADKYES